MSPRSSEVSRSNDSSPSTSLRAWTWMRPERSTTSMKARRRARAAPTAGRRRGRPSRSPRRPRDRDGRRGCSAIGTTPSKACGKGSIPSARRRSNFSRRSSSRDSARRASRFDLGDLQLARGAAGHRHGDDVAALVAEQGLADRRLVRELVRARVGLGGADQLELDRLVGLLVLDVDRDADATSRCRCPCGRSRVRCGASPRDRRSASRAWPARSWRRRTRSSRRCPRTRALP